MKAFGAPWLVFALLSAAFAALTAIFAKVGVANVNSDFATLIRTVIIVAVLAAILAATANSAFGSIRPAPTSFSPFRGWPPAPHGSVISAP